LSYLYEDIKMLLLSHPNGNANVRAILSVLDAENKLHSFYTTVAVKDSDWFIKRLPWSIKKELLRRSYILSSPIYLHPYLELIRLISSKLHISALTSHEVGLASVDSVCNDFDQYVSKRICTALKSRYLTGVYCYEDSALETFSVAKKNDLLRIYDLPIAYWETGNRLLIEEAERLPAWEPTLIGTRNSQAKLDRKTQELTLADAVICPSQFVYNSLPQHIRQSKACVVAEFGSPVACEQLLYQSRINETSPLRLLFVGSMSQRKGLADLFAAMRLLNRADIALVVMGTPLMPLEFYRQQFPDFIYEPPRPHLEVLQLMQSCDVLVLPSIVEGRALVQQEAMVCGLPLIITPNTGGEDLIDEGQTGFLVPIRSPEAIAEKINWFADNRHELSRMRAFAAAKAAQYTWTSYGQKILSFVQNLSY
jgi:glycosyltransferase involved in cell wall biosynthesis